MSCKHIPYQDGNICTSSDLKKMIKDKPYNIYYAQCAVCGEKIAAPKSVTRIKLILDLVGTVGLTRQGTVLCLNGNNYGGVTAAPASLALKGGGPR